MRIRKLSLNPCTFFTRFARTSGTSPGAASRTARMVVAAMFVVGLVACAASGQLLVDFSSTGVAPEAGYQSYEASHEVSASFTTMTYAAFGTTVDVTPVWPDTTDNRVQQMIDRPANNDNAWQGDKIDLITDWIGSDTRTASGGNGDWDRTGATTPTYLTLTLSGLPAGAYRWTSYHHDTENMWSDFQTEVSTDGGSTYGPPIDMEITSSTSGGNPASPIKYWGDTDPDPRSLPSTLVTQFVATGTDDVVLQFACFVDGVDPTGVHKQFFAMNGFELETSEGLPVIAPQPQSQDLILGDPATLTAGFSSLFPATLQWRLDGVAIPGETNTTLEIAAAAPADAGDYDAVVTSSAGSVTSETAVVTVGLPDIDPTAQVVLATFPATFTLTMPTNFPSYAYAWSGPSGPIAGATSSTLTVVNVTAADTGTYTVDVTAGSDTLSASAELTVPAQPGASYTDTILADAPVAYWRLGEGVGSSYAIDEMTPAKDLIIGTTVVAEQPGALLGDPDTAMAFDGTETSVLDRGGSFDASLNTATFSVECWARPTGGSGLRAVVASRDIDTFNGNATAGYEIGRNSGGQWQFRTGTGETNAAQTAEWNTLAGPFTPMQEWAHLVATFDGSDMALYVDGAPAGTLAVSSFMPQVIWETRVGAGANELYPAQDFFVGEVDEVAYYDTALSAQDVLDHYVASFDVTAPPSIVAQPLDVGVLIGDPGTMTVSVLSGTYPTYQWRRGGVDIPGATDQNLVVDPVTLDSGGEYDVVVANAAGSVTSASAFLVPLVDYTGTFVLPDETNTVLTRNGSPTWFVHDNGGAANTGGLWNRRPTFDITQLPSIPWGFEGTQAREDVGDLELLTTVTGLEPNTAYAVWTFLSDKHPDNGGIFSRLLTAFEGEEMRLFSRSNAIDTGLTAVDPPEGSDPWPVYHCFLGIRTSDGSGTISVRADYAEGTNRTVYQGVGYQLAVPGAAPPVISIPPSAQAVLIGSNATFSVSASSTLPLEYQWQFNQVDLPGETNTTLTVVSVQREDAGKYRVVVSNTEGAVNSDEADLVALLDYMGTFVYPDGGNTVLTRDGNANWFTGAQGDAESNGLWWARSDFAVPGIPAATNGFFANTAMEATGDVELRTTLTGLDPTKGYAVWLLFSFPPGGTAERVSAGFEGELPSIYTDSSPGVGVATGGSDMLYHGFLGVRTPNASGELNVIVDYNGLTRSVYNGLGYQLAVLPPEVLMDIYLQGGSLMVDWPSGSGALQESEDLTTPASWVDVPGATSPYMDPGTADQKAFRLRE